MPLYELVVISKSGPQAFNKLKGVMKSTTEMLMDASSAVRKIEFLGHKPLPYRMKHQEAYQYSGSYWTVLFHGTTNVGEHIREKLKFNDEIIRYTLLKRADTLKHLIQS